MLSGFFEREDFICMKIISLDDVIVAVATPPGQGGIGIVRISGEKSIEIADRIFKGKSKVKLANCKSHTLHYGHIFDYQNDNIIDEVLISIMLSPNTYTRQDVVEINCHGGIQSVGKVLQLCLKSGARLAEPGEFTKRAFLNGRIDLSQAEAVSDLIVSKTDISRQAAMNQLEGGLKRQVRKLREQILDVVASIEAAIDYPEHDVEEETKLSMKRTSEAILSDIRDLLNTADKGKIIRDGLQAVILGKPNVGKSSLLNWLLEEDRAIVTNIPGTTRDTVEEYINIEGIPIKIVDTAGIRQTKDEVEKIGVKKSLDYAQKADLLLVMLDASNEITQEDLEILQMAKSKKALILINKSDLNQKVNISNLDIEKENIIQISVLKNTGLENLIKRLKQLFFDGDISCNNEIMIGNVRHKNALNAAKESLEKAIQTIESDLPEDFISMDLQMCMAFLGEITGDTIDEEIIDRIFTKFCLGK